MADRVMRGSRLGAVSYETDRSHDLAPRQIARYRTENGEEFDMPFAADAEIPGIWLCRNGMEGTLIEGADLAEPNKVKVPRTPWDMLRERRSIEELEELLKERLESSSHAAAAASLATGRGREPRAPSRLGGVVNRRHRQQSVAVSHWARFGHDGRFVGLNITSELHKLWCAVLGLNQSRLAKRRGCLRLICYLQTFVVT